MEKPLLVIGGPWGVKAYRRLLDKPAHGDGDVCLDIDRRALEGHPCAVVASCTDIPFTDKSFGAIFSSHVLEHMPTTQMAEKALSEMNRVAGSVFIAYPSQAIYCRLDYTRPSYLGMAKGWKDSFQTTQR